MPFVRNFRTYFFAFVLRLGQTNAVALRYAVQTRNVVIHGFELVCTLRENAFTVRMRYNCVELQYPRNSPHFLGITVYFAFTSFLIIREISDCIIYLTKTKIFQLFDDIINRYLQLQTNLDVTAKRCSG